MGTENVTALDDASMGLPSQRSGSLRWLCTGWRVHTSGAFGLREIGNASETGLYRPSRVCNHRNGRNHGALWMVDAVQAELIGREPAALLGQGYIPCLPKLLQAAGGLPHANEWGCPVERGGGDRIKAISVVNVKPAN